MKDTVHTEAMHRIEAAIARIPQASEAEEKDAAIQALEAIRSAMNAGAAFLIPVECEMPATGPDPARLQPGDTFTLQQDMPLHFRSVQLTSGGMALPAFTSAEEMMRGQPTSTIAVSIEEILEHTMLNADWEGLLINPWGESLMVPKNNIRIIFSVAVEMQLRGEKQQQRETMLKESPEICSDAGKLDEAIRHAVQYHSGRMQPDMQPAILHSLETLSHLAAMDADTNLMIAGVLHDIPVDDETLAALAAQFGGDTGSLLDFCAADPKHGWYRSHLRTVLTLSGADLRRKMLVLADSLAHLRKLYAQLRADTRDTWPVSIPKPLMAWHYSKICDALADMQVYPQTESAFGELQVLFKEIFVTFLADRDKGLLYQISADGERYVLKKGKPRWDALTASVSRTAQVIDRRTAERIEEDWGEPFWQTVVSDAGDAEHPLFESPARTLTAVVEDGELTFIGEDSGEACRIISGRDDYEFSYHLDADSTRRLIAQLRLQHGLRLRFGTILRKAFGSDDGSVRFSEFCESIGIEPEFSSR